MHATDLIDMTIAERCQPIHKTRFDALKAAVTAATQVRYLTVTQLGRALEGISEKHGIKRMDRLVGNEHLFDEIPLIYRALALWRIGHQERPIILVDWSPLTKDNSLHALTASLPSLGRSLPLYQEVHAECDLNGAGVQRKFLDRLHWILPSNCRPVIVTDGGFKNPWFRDVAAKGWDWVGRVRGTTLLSREGEQCWLRTADLELLLKEDKPRYMGRFLLARSNPLLCTLHGLREKPKGRIDKTARGVRARSRKSRVNAEREKEPWLLVTSLSADSALTGDVISTYRRRMQIEEGFRDTKDERFGLGLDVARSRTKERYAVLLLIAALTVFVAWLLGKAADQSGLSRKFQANTITHRRVLSFVFLGMRIIRKGGLTLSFSDVTDAKRSLREAHTFLA